MWGAVNKSISQEVRWLAEKCDESSREPLLHEVQKWLKALTITIVNPTIILHGIIEKDSGHNSFKARALAHAESSVAGNNTLWIGGDLRVLG